MSDAYFLYDPIEGYMETFATEAQALAAAAESLKGYREYAALEGWPEDINLPVGKITHELVMVDKESRPDDLDEDGISASTGGYWPYGCDCKCDYELRPTTQPSKP